MSVPTVPTVSWESLVEVSKTDKGDWNIQRGIINYAVSNNSSFEYIERRFREEKINVRILAVDPNSDWMMPIELSTGKYKQHDASRFKCLDPITKETKKYRIWVLKGGHYIWQLGELQRLTDDATFEENAEKLIDTGVLYTDECTNPMKPLSKDM